MSVPDWLKSFSTEERASLAGDLAEVIEAHEAGRAGNLPSPAEVLARWRDTAGFRAGITAGDYSYQVPARDGGSTLVHVRLRAERQPAAIRPASNVFRAAVQALFRPDDDSGGL